MPRSKKNKNKQKYPQDVNREQRKYRLRPLQPKNQPQQSYLDALYEAKITFGLGPAGTGKTFVASYVACEKLLSGEIDKIVITRPIVEAGEKLGFLPGDLDAKIHPYLLPLLDAFEHFIGPKLTKEFLESGKIEVAPLAFMRGRTLTNAFCILDESQNTTIDQMKMFLTRIGSGTTYAINGDASQSDLEEQSYKPIENGLSWAVRKLRGKTSKIYVNEFRKADVVRHPLIGEMLTHLEAPDEFPEKKTQTLME